MIRGGWTITEPREPERIGYIFDGWYKPGETAKYDFKAPVNEDFSLEARYRPLHHLVTFDLNGGRGETDCNSQEIETGGRVPKPGNPTREGYDFCYWRAQVWDTIWTHNDERFAYDFNRKVTRKMTLLAV